LAHCQGTIRRTSALRATCSSDGAGIWRATLSALLSAEPRLVIGTPFSGVKASPKVPPVASQLETSRLRWHVRPEPDGAWMYCANSQLPSLPEVTPPANSHHPQNRNPVPVPGNVAVPLVRRVIYTTNAIEALNRQLRKAIKTKGHFPTEDSARKLIYLAIHNAVPQWTRTRAWTKALLAFKIQFGDRLPDSAI
jgi:hypothetical protein